MAVISLLQIMLVKKICSRLRLQFFVAWFSSNYVSINDGTLYEFSLNARSEWSDYWLFICIQDKGQFSLLDVDADPRTTSLALSGWLPCIYICIANVAYAKRVSLLLTNSAKYRYFSE